MVEAGSQAKTKIKLMTHVVKHPKFYRIPRDKSDQVISKRTCDGESERAPGPGHKPQAPSSKHQANQNQFRFKLQAPSDKRPNQSNKRQASSHKQQAPRSLSHGTWILEKF